MRKSVCCVTLHLQERRVRRYGDQARSILHLSRTIPYDEHWMNRLSGKKTHSNVDRVFHRFKGNNIHGFRGPLKQYQIIEA